MLKSIDQGTVECVRSWALSKKSSVEIYLNIPAGTGGNSASARIDDSVQENIKTVVLVRVSNLMRLADG